MSVQWLVAKLYGGKWNFLNVLLNLWAHASVCVFMHGAIMRLEAGRWSSLSLSLESEWGCVYPTFTLKISSSDAADTGSFRPLSSSSSTVRSPEMALRISGPMSCNVRRPAYTQTKHSEVLHFNMDKYGDSHAYLLAKKTSTLTSVTVIFFTRSCCCLAYTEYTLYSLYIT